MVVKNIICFWKSAPDWLLGRLRRRPSRALSSAKLKSAAAGLPQVSRALETRFLSTSSGLEKLAKDGADFVQLSEHLLNSATGRVGGSALFLNAVKVVEKPLDFLNDSHVKTSALLQRLKQANDGIDEFISIQAELQRTIAPLKYIQALFKIESAPLGEQVQIMFGSLTKEIEQLHDQVCELFTTKFLELRAIQRTINDVINELQYRTDELWAGIAREKAQIEKSLFQLQEELQKNQEREPRISRIGKEINNDIQQIVMGLQYQDIISQKLQHSGTALEQIQKLLAAREAMGGLGQLCQIEAGQLEAIRQDVAGAEKAIKGGIENILGRLVKADTQCLTLAEFQQLTTSADGMAEILFEVFGTVGKQIAGAVSSSGAAYEKLRPIGGLASDLTVVVRDLSQRIHLIGLNAQVQAAQVGNGGALEVLSARTSEISRATTEISENVAKHLDQLVIGLTSGVKELEALQQEALGQQKCLMEEGAAAEKNLHALRDDALGTLQRLSSLLDDIRDESQTLAHAVDFTESSDAPLVGLIDELKAIIEVFGSAAHPAPMASEMFVKELQSGYTMNSQRDVLASVMGAQVSTPTVSESTVEMFDTSSPEMFKDIAGAVELTVPGQNSSPSSVIPSVGLTGQPEIAQKSPLVAANDFGNNVELF